MSALLAVCRRELAVLRREKIYWLCIVALPVLVIVFFTSLMSDGVPADMPVGVVDLDRSASSRQMTRLLDAMQTTKVVARYPDAAAAREAIQRGEIYAFLYMPAGLDEDLRAKRQPRVSFYCSQASLTAGSLIYRDLKATATLTMAAAGQQALAAKGMTKEQIMAFLQPVAVDLHQLSNPWTSYNIYLSAVLPVGLLMIFIFLVTAYSLSSELKFGRARQLMRTAGDSTAAALAGKLLPQSAAFLAVTAFYMWYLFGLHQFPHPGGWGHIAVLAVLTVAASQGFGAFMFGLLPSVRMSMSICSLWGVISMSMVGSAFPVSSMDAPLQSMSWLFPLRHYFMLYAVTVFEDFPLSDVGWHAVALLTFALLPLTVAKRIGRVWRTHEYIP